VTLDLLRWDAERLLAREGWTDDVAVIVWGLRYSALVLARRTQSLHVGVHDSEWMLAEPGRRAVLPACRMPGHPVGVLLHGGVGHAEGFGEPR
jgi:hypothetical protein